MLTIGRQSTCCLDSLRSLLTFFRSFFQRIDDGIPQATVFQSAETGSGRTCKVVSFEKFKINKNVSDTNHHAEAPNPVGTV